jgi:hypothetical protein
MAVTIDLNPELEAQLRKEAEKTGIDASTFVIRKLEEILKEGDPESASPHLSADESALLQKINQGLPEALWQEYQGLVAKRRSDTLTLDEQTRLIALSDGIEEAHAERMEHVAELAARRQVSLKALMDQLGIKPREV